jgi:arylsulfatase B
MQGYPLSPAEPRALPLDQKLLPQYMKDLGYRTHLLGKWHLGYYDWKFTPLARGFDTHFGYMNGFIGYYDHHMNVKVLPVASNFEENFNIFL